MRSPVLLSSLLLVALTLSFSACSSAEDEEFVNEGDYHAHDDAILGEDVDSVAQGLVPTDPVSKVVTDGCSTGPVMPLAKQLNAEINCLSPNALTSIDKVQGLKFSSSNVAPTLQTFAANSLKKVIASRGTTLVVNYALRTLPEQYVLYRYYLMGRCGISLAASPGNSNHESGLAVDVQDNAGWRSHFLKQGWRWQGAIDPYHYEIAGGVNMRGLSTKAFQRLWNRNNPNDKIAEDGQYGPATEARLTKSPIGGFPIGAVCDQPKPDAGAADAAADVETGDGGTGDDVTDPNTGSNEDDGTTNEGPGSTSGTGNEPPSQTPPSLDGDDASSGCSAGTRGATSHGLAALLGASAVALLVSRRRRRGA